MAKKQLTPEQYKAKLEKKAEKRKKFAGLFFKTVALCLAGAVAYSTTAMAFIKIDRATKAYVVSGDSNSTTTTTDTPVQTPSVDWNQGTSTDSGSTDAGSTDGEQSAATVMTSTSMQFDLFTKALKGAKTNAKSVTIVKKNAYNYDEYVNAGGNVALEAIGKALMGSLLKAEDVNTTYTGADVASNFPPSGATSGLTKDDVQSIDCKEDGNYYIITVVVKGTVDPKPGQSVGAVANILTTESIEEPLKQYGLTGLTFKKDYKATTAEAKIEKSTGNLVEYYFDMPMYLYVGDMASVGLGFEEWWTAEY